MARRRARGARRGAGTVLLALAAGLAGGMLAPILMPRLKRGARPAAKQAMKLGLAAIERGRERATELAETASDLLAEAQAEYALERLPAAAAEAPEARTTPAAPEVVALHGAQREPPARHGCPVGRHGGGTGRGAAGSALLMAETPALPEGRLTHVTAGRLRIRIPEKRRDAAFFRRVEERLRAAPGAARVTVNPATAGVLVVLRDAPAFMADLARCDLFALAPQPGGAAGA